jgi:Holliday junction resolvase RusA-like endonuclease/endogenous inhibitor of DNA gyrase (YacG/DUF329 family)
MTKARQVSRRFSAVGLDEDPEEATVWKLHRELDDMEVVAQLMIPGEPASKARPRFDGRGSKTRAYTPEKTKSAEAQVAWHFSRARPDWRADGQGHFGLMAVFFCESRQRRDVDNMIKLLLDGLNKVVWHDDVQVIEVSARKVVGVAPARTELLLYRTWGYEAPTRNCEHCGKPVRLYASTRETTRYCSRACEQAARDKQWARECPQCGKQYRARRSDQVFCGRECSDQGRRRGWGRSA